MARRKKPLQLRLNQGDKEEQVETMIGNNPLNIANAPLLDDPKQYQNCNLHVAYLPPSGRMTQLRLGLCILRNQPIEQSLTPVRLTSFEIVAQRDRLRVALDGDIRIMEPPLHYK